MLTRWLIFHVASGQAFFSGVACILVALGLAVRARHGGIRVLRNILIGLGGVLIFVSATPLSLWNYGFLLIVSLLWVAGEASQARLSSRLIAALRWVVAISWLVTGLAEARYHFQPHIPALGRPILGIVGDSVTAGLGEGGVPTWPKVLANRHGVRVRDHSAAGATTASATRQAEAISAEERLVLLEIGGNDLLGGTPSEDYETALAHLLAMVCQPGRVVVMFELPLLPGTNGFGKIQRRLARQYGVRLIPKRVLAGVLLQEGSSFDSIHLSQHGHARMAASVWEVVREAYAEERSPGI